MELTVENLKEWKQQLNKLTKEHYPNEIYTNTKSNHDWIKENLGDPDTLQGDLTALRDALIEAGLTDD